MITMKDIAVRAGVSRSTVSLVLNEKHTAQGISDDTCLRIRTIARELGYRRNSLARAVVTGKNPLFVFLIPVSGLESEVITRILTGIMAEAEAYHHTVQIIRIAHDEQREAVQQCVELRPRGVLTVYPTVETLELLHHEMPPFGIPVVVLDCSYPVPYGTKVVSDDADGVRQAMTHLLELGHHRIAHIGGFSDHGVSIERGESYQRMMKSAGITIPDGYLRYSEWDYDYAGEIAQSMFTIPANEKPTAVLCADDKIAMVVCRTLYRLGMRVPDDVSVIGFADLAMAAFCSPPLTTVAQPFLEMGKVAIRQLVNPIHDEKTNNEAERYRVPTQLILRESTAPVSHGSSGRTNNTPTEKGYQ